MVTPVPLSRRLRSAAIVFGGLGTGLALIAAPLVARKPQLLELWVIGIPLTGLFGYGLARGVAFRLRYRTPEERAAARERLLGTGPGRDADVRRGYFARRAADGKDGVLAAGIDGTAVITFLADIPISRGSRQLVYLELDVTVEGGTPYHARTGEFLGVAAAGSVAPGRQLAVRIDRADPQRVAVDWERTLRLTR